MSDQISALKLFVRVARTGNFSRGARELNLSQPTASRIIANLEEQLGATLFVRTTRAVTLTDVGESYLNRVVCILTALEEANLAARGTGELEGTLRVGACSMFTSRAIVPHMAEFIKSHPALKVEFVVDDRTPNLIAEALDVALPLGDLAESSSIAQRLGAWPLMLVASPIYLAQHGTPTSPSELAMHDIILNRALRRKVWRMTRDFRTVTIEPQSRLSFSTSEVAIRAAVAGFGIMLAIAPTLLSELSSGELVSVLPEWRMGCLDMHALFPSGQAPKPSAKAFADYLAANIQAFKEPTEQRRHTIPA